MLIVHNLTKLPFKSKLSVFNNFLFNATYILPAFHELFVVIHHNIALTF